VIFDFRIILFAAFIFLSLKELRDYHQNGVLFFWQGMIGSYVFIITSALIGSAFTWSFAGWNTGFLPSYIQKLQQQMILYKTEIITSVGQEAYHQQLAKLPFTSAGDLAADYFLKSMIIGLFLTILISVLLRKQPKTE
jgi:ABC-type antimicrobial peptide transport system permease subunit